MRGWMNNSLLSDSSHQAQYDHSEDILQQLEPNLLELKSEDQRCDIYCTTYSIAQFVRKKSNTE